MAQNLVMRRENKKFERVRTTPPHRLCAAATLTRDLPRFAPPQFDRTELDAALLALSNAEDASWTPYAMLRCPPCSAPHSPHLARRSDAKRATPRVLMTAISCTADESPRCKNTQSL